MLHLSSQLRCHIIVPSCVSYSNVRHMLSMLLFSMETRQISSNLSLLCPEIPSWIIASFFSLCEGVCGREISWSLADVAWLDGKNKTRISTRCQMVQQVQQSIVCVYIEFKRDVVLSCCDLLRPLDQSHPVPTFSFSLFNEGNLLRESTNDFVSLLLHVLFLV